MLEAPDNLDSIIKPNFDLLTYQEVKRRLEAIPRDHHRVFLKTIYGGCARVGEIVRKKTFPSTPSICLDDLIITDDRLSLKVRTEKNPSARIRVVPLARTDNDGSRKNFLKNEAWLTEDLIKFFNEHPQTGIYNYSTFWAEKVFREHFPEYHYHIHYLRHWRATHLITGEATGKPLPYDAVQRIGGWSNAGVVSRVYSHTTVEDYW